MRDATDTMLVQLTDLHIREPGRLAYGRIDTAPYLRTAVRSVLRLRQRPQAVVITGDLTDFGRPAEYAHLAELLAPLDAPVYLLPGNHDDRDQMRRSFPDHAWLGSEGEFIQYSVQVGHFRLVTLDTCEPGKSHGTLDAPRLQWLERELDAYRHQPVVIAMHHPPFETLIGHMDDIGLLQGAAELEGIVARHPNRLAGAAGRQLLAAAAAGRACRAQRRLRVHRHGRDRTGADAPQRPLQVHPHPRPSAATV